VVESIVIPDASSEPEAYVAALLDALGDRDPLEVYGGTAEAVARLCDGLDRNLWNARPGEGEWSAYQLLGHLLDVDIVYGFRWRLVLTAEVPTYPGYDERAWAKLPKPAPALLLHTFTTLRWANLTLVANVNEAAWSRQGVHGEQGTEDMCHMLRKIAGHDLAHLNQLQRTVEEARWRQSQP
jgi:hypothetical protein